MLMPSVSRYMTREPYRVTPTCTMETARALMQRHAIRHLPVLDGDKLVGVITDNDVRIAASVPGVDLAHIACARLMSTPVYVWGETLLDEVVAIMEKRKSDCVVVLGGHGVQGVFTATDALRALGDILDRATA